jgi:DNA-binding XRE family transcriptional regulator
MAKNEVISEHKRHCGVKPVNEHLKELLKDPYFREQYELDLKKLKLVKPIIAYRIKHKLSQGELAKKVGVTQQHISKIENGEFSSIVTLEKVLLFIGFTVKIQVAPLAKSIRERLLKKTIPA